jgi:hypothetical protein
MMDANQSRRENRLRRTAARQGLRLSKSARRDPHADDYGRYRLEDRNQPGAIVAGGSPFDYSLDLDGVEEILFWRTHHRHGHPLNRDEDYENAITPHAPHDGDWHAIAADHPQGRQRKLDQAPSQQVPTTGHSA